jgi:hypothetical protein
MMRRTLVGVVCGVLVGCALAAEPDAPKPPAPQAQPKPPPKPEPPAYTTVETAGPDFALQGEYEGTAGKDKLGVQVIALDKGAFHAVVFRGGLPGAGWDGSAKVEFDGKTEDGKTTFAGNKWSAAIAAETMTGKTDKDEAFTLKRVLRRSPTEGAKPPAGAVVLFDGTNADAWQGGKLDDRKLLNCGVTSKQAFGDCLLHIEFLLPFKPGARGQGRGNSGVYIQNRYEVQVLDSFGLKGVDNECGGIYKTGAPKVNMCLPPLSWQTYDIEFKAARFDETGKKTASAVTTVKHNGVVIHENLEIPKSTGGGKPEGATPGPIHLQNHGNPVFFRNIWVVERK